MNFKKKLKIRLYVAIAYIVLGLALMVGFNLLAPQNEFFSYFGFALVIMGIARIRNYFLITKNNKTLQKQEIAESDERNIYIAQRAKSIAFLVYIIAAGLVVITLHILNKTVLATTISYTVCALIFIYWVSYFIISKKS